MRMKLAQGLKIFSLILFLHAVSTLIIWWGTPFQSVISKWRIKTTLRMHSLSLEGRVNRLESISSAHCSYCEVIFATIQCRWWKSKQNMRNFHRFLCPCQIINCAHFYETDQTINRSWMYSESHEFVLKRHRTKSMLSYLESSSPGRQVTSEETHVVKNWFPLIFLCDFSWSSTRDSSSCTEIPLNESFGCSRERKAHSSLKFRCRYTFDYSCTCAEATSDETAKCLKKQSFSLYFSLCWLVSFDHMFERKKSKHKESYKWPSSSISTWGCFWLIYSAHRWLGHVATRTWKISSSSCISVSSFLGWQKVRYHY